MLRAEGPGSARHVSLYDSGGASHAGRWGEPSGSGDECEQRITYETAGSPPFSSAWPVRAGPPGAAFAPVALGLPPRKLRPTPKNESTRKTLHYGHSGGVYTAWSGRYNRVQPYGLLGYRPPVREAVEPMPHASGPLRQPAMGEGGRPTQRVAPQLEASQMTSHSRATGRGASEGSARACVGYSWLARSTTQGPVSSGKTKAAVDAIRVGEPAQDLRRRQV